MVIFEVLEKGFSIPGGVFNRHWSRLNVSVKIFLRIDWRVRWVGNRWQGKPWHSTPSASPHVFVENCPIKERYADTILMSPTTSTSSILEHSPRIMLFSINHPRSDYRYAGFRGGWILHAHCRKVNFFYYKTVFSVLASWSRKLRRSDEMTSYQRAVRNFMSNLFWELTPPSSSELRRLTISGSTLALTPCCLKFFVSDLKMLFPKKFYYLLY